MTGRLSPLMFLALLMAGCGSPVPTDTPITGPPPLALTGAGPFLVSNPVSLGSGNPIQGSAPSGQVAFVSLPPGTLAGGTAVSLRVLRTGSAVSAALVDGGLDPVAIAAVVGDTVALTVTGTVKGAGPYVFTIPPRKPPVIVRTVPGRTNGMCRSMRGSTWSSVSRSTPDR